MVSKRFRSDNERDPIAELARLIAEADSHEESTPSDSRLRKEQLRIATMKFASFRPRPSLPSI
jgi:hypothetical protein